MREYEEIAQRIVAKVLGVPVVQNNFNNGRSVPDLKIDYSGQDRDRPAGFIEVVSDTSRSWRRLHHALDGGNTELLVPGLTYDWWVWPKVNARISTLLPALPGLLRRLDQAGETFDHLRESSDGLQRRMRASPFFEEINKLGIAELVAGAEANGDAVVRFVLPGNGGPAEVDMNRLASWSEEFLGDQDISDVRRKLAATNAPERHAFVVVTLMSEWAVHHALTRDGYGQLPGRAPALPEDVTHLWLLGTECADRCIAWLPDRGGWIDYANGPWHRPSKPSDTC